MCLLLPNFAFLSARSSICTSKNATFGNKIHHFQLQKRNQDRLLQESHYYPFGLSIEALADNGNPNNQYQYNGKERNEELGLEWLDYGARWYDPQLARWGSVDPLADKYDEWSPYNYVMNNPTLLVDPDGREVTYSIVYDKDNNPTINPHFAVILLC